jgi:type IV pilus assembly protein PilF
MLKVVSALVLVVLLSACISTVSDRTSIPDPLAAAKNRLALGLTYLKSNNFQQAKFNIDKALDFAPRFADAHYGIAYYYQKVGENQLANDSYLVALNLDSDNPEIANSYGAFLCTQGEYDKAQNYFFIAIDNQNYLSTAQTYENLAICSQTQGDTFAAIDYLNKALNFEPTRQNSLYLLAELYASQNEHDKALSTIKSYERVVGPNPDSMYLSFDVGLSQGDQAKARGWLNVLKSRYPNHPNTLQAQTKLDEYALQAKKQALAIRQQERNQQASNQQNIEQSGPSAVPLSTPVTHTLRAGETLYRLSRQYNVSVFDIMTWNNISQTDSLSVGIKLIVGYN